uniref:C-type lectin domain-containing protein n=1 Tax=Panagrolaimus sp. ES5 TaxID=591445 RepID=A0AC34G4E2_9BILA
MKKSFFLAENFCNQQQNGHLVSIHNGFDSALIREGAQNNFTDSSTSDFWIGLDDLKTFQTWEWIDGSLFNFPDWDKGQPQNSPGYDCGAANLLDGRWKSDDCDNKKPFVCMIKDASTLPPTNCPNNWSFYETTGYCYYVGVNNITWESAQDSCVLQGSNLASIHSIDENNFVLNLIPFNPNNLQCNMEQWAWIGLFSVTNQTTWRWIDNSPYNYSLWAPGWPVPGDYNCAVLWNGPPCNQPVETWAVSYCLQLNAFYICKKKPLTL